jgi:hypothetical protein
MARGDQQNQQQVWQVVEPFAVFKAGAPDIYSRDRMVRADDPILRSHRANFAPVSERVSEPVRLVAAPSIIPRPPVAGVPVEVEETTHG